MVAGEFVNKQDWLSPTIALTVWALHFIVLWCVSSIFPGQDLARWIALGLTVPALAALWIVWRRRKVPGFATMPGLGMGIAGVGIVYSALPAVVG